MWNGKFPRSAAAAPSLSLQVVGSVNEKGG